MKRRAFLGVLGAAALAWPEVVQAQSAPPKVGVLVNVGPEPVLKVFREALREYGYVEGKNIQFEVRSAEGKPELLDGLAAELVRLKVDVIFANQTPAAYAAKKATTEIPIVVNAADPVGTGLVESLARPGGNLTGMSSTPPELGGKLLEFGRDLLPAARIVVLANPTDPFTRSFVDEITRAARVFDMESQTVMVRSVADLETEFATAAGAGVRTIIVQPSLPRKPIIDLALKYRLAAISPTGFFPREGGLMSYSASLTDLFRRSAAYLDQVLKGAKPATLPIQLPTKFELVINMQTAKTIGLSVPPRLLVQADEVIE